MLPRMAAACNDPHTDPDALADLLAWREAYRARLLGATGWWAVSNLCWLDDADAAWLGGGSDDALRLPARVPARLALIERQDDALTVTPTVPGSLVLDGASIEGPVRSPVGARLTLRDDPDVCVAVVVRGDRWGVRVFDAAQARARHADPVGWFEPDTGWCVDAVAEAPAAGATLTIVDVLGATHEAAVAARLRFALGGREHALLATHAGERLFLNFRDATNGTETYGAGRFLSAPLPIDGRTVLDFHRAHHPPCAHTPYAMCPLPPLANRLAVAVRAGERWPEAAAIDRTPTRRTRHDARTPGGASR